MQVTLLGTRGSLATPRPGDGAIRREHLVPFHHDPGHSDTELDRLLAEAIAETKPAYLVTPGTEGTAFDL